MKTTYCRVLNIAKVVSSGHEIARRFTFAFPDRADFDSYPFSRHVCWPDAGAWTDLDEIEEITDNLQQSLVEDQAPRRGVAIRIKAHGVITRVVQASDWIQAVSLLRRQVPMPGVRYSIGLRWQGYAPVRVICRTGSAALQEASIILQTMKPAGAPSGPGLPAMVKSLVRSVGDWGKDGFRLTDEVEADRRMAICKSCEHFKLTACSMRCSLCGCFLSAKLRLKSESCPIGMW